ncbi:hypothetical protein LTR37_004249 [Vermiconidia calcicola]|uniref:Uncharacterized protein n=1 Tax=Vermiconidia calcicola TaxID=1690605 RepID=A0ACC3NP50_9PEZI|nr:hypothetical protein LTR37_004249 [Vermiconidia calcicola]
MIFTIFTGFLASSIFHVAQSGFVPAPTDLITKKGHLDLTVRYKEVPEGICELTPGVKSYSGYVDIEEHQHIFFWFFEARNQDPATAPLTVWINGGPGSSSMIGLFQELGPCGVDSNGDVYNNPYAWNNISNMLFIDHRAQVGFSYSDPIPGYISSSGSIIELPDETCPHYAHQCGTYSYPSPAYTANSTRNSAPSMWKTVQGFTGAFPKYSRSGFNFATESYGGHYGPVYNQSVGLVRAQLKRDCTDRTRYIEEQNDLIDAGELPGAHRINLETVLIGNGWYDPLLQYESYYNFSVYPGNTYDIELPNGRFKQQMYNAMYGPGNCYDMILMCRMTLRNDVCSAADNFCYAEVEYLFDIATGRDEYDVRYLVPDPFPYNYYPDYLNSPKVQQAIGAYVNFSDSNSAVGGAFGNTGDDARLQGAIGDSRKLIEGGTYTVQFSGDADYICNWIGNEAAIERINPPGWSSAGYSNISTSDDIVHGQVKQSDNFAFARIYDAGHEVPFYQPLVALEMFDRAINGLDIATGERRVSKGGDYRTSGPSKSTYREGGRTVVRKVLPADSTYNTTTDRPNPPASNSQRSASDQEKRRKRQVRPRLSPYFGQYDM